MEWPELLMTGVTKVLFAGSQTVLIDGIWHLLAGAQMPVGAREGGSLLRLYQLCLSYSAQMLAAILVLFVSTIRLVGSNANNIFSSVASSVQ
jgi:hypothetical protein